MEEEVSTWRDPLVPLAGADAQDAIGDLVLVVQNSHEDQHPNNGRVVFVTKTIIFYKLLLSSNAVKI